MCYCCVIIIIKYSKVTLPCSYCQYAFVQKICNCNSLILKQTKKNFFVFLCNIVHVRVRVSILNLGEIYIFFSSTHSRWSWRVCVRGQFNNCSIFHTVTIIPLCLSRPCILAFKFLFSRGD